MVGLKGEAQLPVVLKSGACESLLFVIPLSTVSYCAWSAVSTRQAPVAASSVAPAFLWRPRGRSQLNGRDVGQASRDAVGQATRTGCRMSMMSEPARKPPPGFDDLPVDQQIVVELYYWEELNAREIAEIYEVPEPTIRTRLRRAKLRLEQELCGLASTPQIARQTLTSLDAWARRLRDQLDEPERP